METIYSTKEEIIQEFIRQGSTENLALYFIGTRKSKLKKQYQEQDIRKYLNSRNGSNTIQSSLPTTPGNYNSNKKPHFNADKKGSFVLSIEKYFWNCGINNYEEAATIFLCGINHSPDYILSRSEEQLSYLCNIVVDKIKNNHSFNAINEMDLSKYCYRFNYDVLVITSKNRFIQQEYIDICYKNGYKYQLQYPDSNNSIGCAENSRKAIEDYLSQQINTQYSSPGDL